jgi:SAM-dependent methyltransferase
MPRRPNLMSVIFQWKLEEMADLLATCELDGLKPFILKYFAPGSRILESGCGSGRYVKYLHDRGWKATGLEKSQETVAMVRSVWPELDIVQGDVASSPFADGAFDGLLSIGVVEHWPEGPSVPLRELHRVLRQGGVALITVPAQNTVRRLKRLLWLDELIGFARATAVRALTNRGGSLRPNRLKEEFVFPVYPPYGDFFEYRMTTAQFIEQVKWAGFEIVEFARHGIWDGIHHELNPLHLCTKFQRWRFVPTKAGVLLHSVLSRHPALVAHMQLVVARRM